LTNPDYQENSTKCKAEKSFAMTPSGDRGESCRAVPTGGTGTLPTVSSSRYFLESASTPLQTPYPASQDDAGNEIELTNGQSIARRLASLLGALRDS